MKRTELITLLKHNFISLALFTILIILILKQISYRIIVNLQSPLPTPTILVQSNNQTIAHSKSPLPTPTVLVQSNNEPFANPQSPIPTPTIHPRFPFIKPSTTPVPSSTPISPPPPTPSPTKAVYPNIGHLDDETVGVKRDDKSEYTKEMLAEKEADFQHSLNSFLEKYPAAKTPGLDTIWLDQIASTSENDPIAMWTYGLIQFPQPFDLEARRELEAVGVKFYSNIGGGALKVALNRTALPILQRLADEGRVLYGGPIPPTTKIDPTLQVIIDTDPNSTIAVRVIFFEPPTPAQLEFINSLISQQGAFLQPPTPTMRGEIEAQNISTLSELSIIDYLKPHTANSNPF